MADSLVTIFNNWDEYKFKTFTTQITPEKFSIAFSNNPEAVADSLVTIFYNWDKFGTLITYLTSEKFSIAFSNNPRAVVDSLRIIFNNWNEYKELAESFISRGSFLLDSYASENNIEEQSATFSVIKSLELLRFFKDLSLKGRVFLASEILQREGLKGLFLMLKFFYEFRPMFFNDRDGFIEYFLDKNKLEIEPRHYIFRFGRNLLYVEIDKLTGKRTYVITKIFGNNNAARKELNGLRILSQFGALKDPEINTKTHTVTYRVNEPGIFIMPTDVLVFASKEEMKALCQSLIEKTLQQIYTLAKSGYVHTSLTAVSHGAGDNGQSIGWVAYRGGDINDLRGLNHVNFRPGIGMVDAEHIFNDFEADIGLHTLDPRILKIDIGGSSFEVTLGIIYGAIKNGLTVDDILPVFNSIKLNVYFLEGRQEEVNIFKGSEDKIRNLYYDVLRGRVNHQRNTDGFLVWLENNLPDVNKVKTEGNVIILPPVSGNYLKNPGGILLINQSL